MKRLMVLVLGVAWLMGCADEQAETLQAHVGDSQTVEEVDHPEVAIPPTSAATKRLTADQIESSLPIVLGDETNGDPMGWTMSQYEGTFDAFVLLSRSLGKPDYLEITEENREPSALYVKFMGDMARTVCEEALKSDISKDNPDDRVIVRFADWSETEDAQQINDNLRYLKLRFLADRIADDDDESVAALKAIFDTGAAEATTNQKAASGWYAVCVALVSSPSFHLY